MQSFRKKEGLLKGEDTGYYHVSMQRQKLKKNLKLPRIIDQKDAAHVRQFLFEKAVESFNDDNKNNMISFEINPKTIDINMVGNENSGRFDMNRQRHFIATDYISKDTIINEVEKVKKWMALRTKKGVKKRAAMEEAGEDIPEVFEMSRYIEKKWDNATYWHNNWFGIYNVCKDDEHIIGFASVSRHDGDGVTHEIVRPNDIVFDVREEKYAYFNENTFDVSEGKLAQNTALEIKKKPAKKLAS